MKALKLKYSTLLMPLIFFQLMALFIFLGSNIINIGKAGVAFPILVIFFVITIFIFTILSLYYNIYLKINLLFFLLFVIFLSLRVIIDLHDFEYLKQITIATTGGIVFFYFLGVFCGVSYLIIFNENKKIFAFFVLLLFLLLLGWMKYSFSFRIRTDIFLLKDINGAYQRPGNFFSILFIILSFVYFLLSFENIQKKNKKLKALFEFIIYSAIAFVSLLCSQLISSNSATAVILGVYFITIIISLMILQRDIWLSYMSNKLKIPWSKKFILRLLLLFFLVIITIVFLIILLVLFTDFDFNKLRVFGFGSYSNTSLMSRLDILFDTGITQLTYAPFLGDMNVALYVTGNSGRYLHNFIPNIMSQLGLVGLFIIICLFFHVFYNLYSQIINKKIDNTFENYKKNMLNLYFLLILLYIFLFANMSTSMSWAVIWFTLGMVSNPLSFRKK